MATKNNGMREAPADGECFGCQPHNHKNNPHPEPKGGRVSIIEPRKRAHPPHKGYQEHPDHGPFSEHLR